MFLNGGALNEVFKNKQHRIKLRKSFICWIIINLKLWT